MVPPQRSQRAPRDNNAVKHRAATLFLLAPLLRHVPVLAAASDISAAVHRPCRYRPGLSIKFCARGLPSSGGRGIASPGVAVSLLDTPNWYTRRMARDVQVSAGGVYDLGLHVVWCPKYRRQVLSGQVGIRLRELIDAKAAEHGWRIVACEIMPDHVHLFVKTTPKDSPAFVASQFKGSTSRALRQEFPHLRSRLPTLWSRSYFAAIGGGGVGGDRAAVHRHAV